MRRYVDASATTARLIEEPESNALTAFLDRAVAGGDDAGSSRLLETELRTQRAFRVLRG